MSFSDNAAALGMSATGSGGPCTRWAGNLMAFFGGEPRGAVTLVPSRGLHCLDVFCDNKHYSCC